MQFPGGLKEEHENKEGRIVFTLTEKEVRLLPAKLRKTFRACGFKVCAVRRETTGIWEVRKQIEGIKLYASSKKLEEAKRKFIQELRDLANGEKLKRQIEERGRELREQEQKRHDFCRYVEQFIQTVKKPAVKAVTYRAYEQALRLYIAPSFSGKCLEEITRQDCQDFFNGFLLSGHYRTAQIVHQLVSAAFNYAVQDDIIKKSPMALVKLPPMERAHGTALTLMEEKELVQMCMSAIEQPAMQAVLFTLYTGIRRSELAGAVVEDKFVSIANSKLRKGRRQTVRRIPITPMLRSVLSYITAEAFAVTPDRLTRTVKLLSPKHHTHELRHTFISRCKECGVVPEVVSIWAGHTLSGTVTTTVYTHYSDEFMLREADKVRYEL